MAEAKRRADKLDIEAYAAKAKKYVATHDLSEQANAEMRLYNLTMKVNRLELLKARIGMQLVDGFSELEGYETEKLTDRTYDEIKRQAGILGGSVATAEKMVESIVGASFHNATFSQRIWAHQEQLRYEIGKQLSIGLIQGRNPKVLAKEIQKAFGVSKYNAQRLMRTEMARVQTDAQLLSYERNGFEWFEFHALGEKACPICRALDGKKFKVREMLISENAPPMHPNCRCSTSAAMPAFDSWQNSGAAKNGVAYNDFESLYIPDKKEITFDDSYDAKINANEIMQAKWIVNTFGGRIRLLKRSLSRPTPDYKWNDKYWELKTPRGTNGTDKLVHHGLHQINNAPGGIILECGNKDVNLKKAIELAEARLHRSGKDKEIRIIVKVGNEIIAILK